MSDPASPLPPFGPLARNRIDLTGHPGRDGSDAALETFYHAFNHRDASLLDRLWAMEQGPALLLNPLGGIVSGRADAVALYRTLFASPARVEVTFHDPLPYPLGDRAILYSGRERGSFARGDRRIDLAIRTSRLFVLETDNHWRQLFHHGSIDDPALLAAYQQAATR